MSFRRFLGVLALGLAATLPLAPPAHAGIIKVFDITFTTIYPSFNDVSGEFTAQFDPTQSIHSFASIVSLSGLPSPRSTGIFDWAPEQVGFTTPFVLTLRIDFGVPTGFEGFFTLRTFGLDDSSSPVANCLSGAGVTETFGGQPFRSIPAESCQTNLISVRSLSAPPPQVPLPAGFILLGTGLVGLGAVEFRYRRRNRL